MFARKLHSGNEIQLYLSKVPGEMGKQNHIIREKERTMGLVAQGR